MRRTHTEIFLAASLLATPAAILSQGVPAFGPELPVNAYTTGGQTDADVSADGSGNFVIVWDSTIHDTPGLKEIEAQRFDSLGTPIGPEFQINAYTFSDQINPRVASDDAGNFVVVWEGQAPGDTTGVSAHRFDSNGAELGMVDILVGNTTAYTSSKPSVARNANGFIVAWIETVPVVGTRIAAQRYDPDGDPVGVEIQVNTHTTVTSSRPEIAVDATGRFVVAWCSESEIRARAFDNTATGLGPDFVVNTTTSGEQYWPSVAIDANGNFVVVWGERIGYNTGPLRAQRYDAAAQPVGAELTLNSLGSDEPRIVHRDLGGYAVVWDVVRGARYDENMTPIGTPFTVPVDTQFTHTAGSVAAGGGRQLDFAWASIDQKGEIGAGVFTRRGGFPDWAPFQVDEHPSCAGGCSDNLNGVLEAGEDVLVETAYQNLSGLSYPLTGTASNFTGPAGPTYLISGTADYGTIPANLVLGETPTSNVADCYTASGQCYKVSILGGRPSGVAHWDTTFDEALSEGVSITRTLHVGGSFNDVPGSSLFIKYVENLFHNGITAGGACGGYCPTDGVKRQQMAVFLLKSKLGQDYFPPAPTGTIFADVPLSNPFAAWIEDLYNRGITGGCASNPLQFCPDAIVNRQQMAVFLLKAAEGSVYDPPDCTGIFADVPCTPGTGFSDWIEDLYNRQITGGCATGPLQYCPTNPTNRQQMAAFLVKNFNLVLYGP